MRAQPAEKGDVIVSFVKDSPSVALYAVMLRDEDFLYLPAWNLSSKPRSATLAPLDAGIQCLFGYPHSVAKRMKARVFPLFLLLPQNR